MSNMIVIGDSHSFNQLELKCIESEYKQFNLISIVNLNTKDLLIKLDDLINIHNKLLVVLNIDGPVSSELLSYLTKIEQKDSINFITIKSLLEQKLNKMHIPRMNTDISFLEKVSTYSRFEYAQKRLIDYLGIIFLSIVSWPIIIYSIYRIKKESPEGSVLFKQKRVGFCGNEFLCIKFRSMSVDAEKNGAQFATEDDPRVFKWGRFMRKARIDELPQIINILKGEMHLVGPRPERKIWTNRFKKEIPYYNERHLVRPGVTGWAQVMYPYGANAEDARQKLMYDLYYMKEWNIFLELKTLIKTFRVVLSGSGK